ncbi:MAG: glutamate 5-kinase [Planctomycetota bacterium]
MSSSASNSGLAAAAGLRPWITASEFAAGREPYAAIIGGLRKSVAHLKRVVVKVGSNLVSGGADSGVDGDFLARLADQIARLRQSGVEVLLVSSGAISAGTRTMKLAAKPTALPERQAISTIGQVALIDAYQRVFQAHGIPVGQVLLTRTSTTDRSRYLNARNALNALLTMGAIPVINENDAVATEEILFGDNDQLSANVALLSGSEALIILTDRGGLLTADPAKHPDAERIAGVAEFNDELMSLAGPSNSGVGTGGMQTKVSAARMVTRSGEICLVADGRAPEVLPRLMAGEDIGTLFAPIDRKLHPRKRWLAFGLLSRGIVVIDAGAVEALQAGKSLLARGVREVKSTDGFDVGDMILIVDPEGREVARGLTHYKAADLARIKGLKTGEIEAALGRKTFDEVVHRDNLVLMQSSSG